MSEQTSEMAKAALREANPFRKGMAWWIVMLEGLVVLGIGIYVATHPNAGTRIVLLLGAYLLLVSIERTLNGFRDRIPQVVLGERMLRAGIGLTVGLLIVLNAWQGFMTATASLVILSLGWLLIGLIGIWEWVIASRQLGMGMGAIIFPSIYTAFGLLMLGSRLSMGPMLMQILGYVAILGGVGLLGFAFMLYRKANASPAEHDTH